MRLAEKRERMGRGRGRGMRIKLKQINLREAKLALSETSQAA